MTAETEGVAEEARRLFDALDERVPGWLREDLGTSVQAAVAALGASAEHVRHVFDEVLDDSLATESAECKVCPVCRLIALVRDRDDPEVRRLVETIGTAAASMLGLLDSVLDDRRRRSASNQDDVEHIDIG